MKLTAALKIRKLEKKIIDRHLEDMRRVCPKVWLTGYYHRLLPVKYKGVHQLFVLPWTKEILDLHDSKTNIGLQDACTKLPTFVQLIKLFD